ncbi:flagellar hook-length control protein [Undibacterium arcticum]
MSARKKTLRIDISGIGQIRLTDDKALADISASASIDAAHGELVSLMPGSTLWPMLLLLSLKHEDGRTWVVPVLRDNVASDAFRRLSVACCWIAAHNQADKPTISKACE